MGGGEGSREAAATRDNQSIWTQAGEANAASGNASAVPMMKFPIWREQAAVKKRAEALAGLILESDIPKRLLEENQRLRAWAEDEQRKRESVEEDRLAERQTNNLLRAVLVECKHGAEYPDDLGNKIDAVLGVNG